MSNINIIVAAQVQGAVQGLDKVTKSTQRVSKEVDRATSKLNQHANGYSKTAVATNKWAKGALQQAGYQVGDFVVQIQNGTNGLQAFGQQGSQLAGVFGPMGAVVGAGIAIFSSLAIAIQKAAGSGREFSEVLSDSNDALDQYLSLASKASSANSDYFTGLKELHGGNSELLADLLAIEKSKAFETIKELNKAVYATVKANGWLNVSMNENITSLLGVGNTSSSTREKIRGLEQSFKDLNSSGDLEGQYQAALKIKSAFTEIVGPVSEMSSEQQKFYQNLLQSIQQMTLLGAATAKVVGVQGEAYQALNDAMFDYYTRQANQEEAAALERKKNAYIDMYDTMQAQIDKIGAYQQYAQLRSTSEQMQARQNAKILEIQKSGWAGYYQSRIAGEYLVAQAAAKAAAAPQVGRSAGRGGPTSEELALHNMQLQLVQQQAAWEKKLADLNKKRSSGTKELAKVVSTELSPELKRAAELGDSVAASFENSMMSAVDGTMKVKDAFKSMALEIIKELYRVFVVKQITGFISNAVSFMAGPKTGNTGTMGLPSFAGGGSTGSAPRSGGLDGKGGFMAMLHPRETVVDHTKGQSTGGVTVVQNINISTGVQQTVRAEIKTLMPQIADAAKSAVVDAKRRGGSYGRAMA